MKVDFTQCMLILIVEALRVFHCFIGCIDNAGRVRSACKQPCLSSPHHQGMIDLFALYS